MKIHQNVWKRILSVIMVFAMVFALLPVPAANAAETSKVLYLKPNSNWTQANARFAAYFFGNGEKWVSMTDSNGDGIYEVEAPAGYPNVIFCRMNPSTTANNWNNKWNQTADLTVPSNGNNLFTIPNGSWDGATTAWSTHTFVVTLGGSNVTSSGAATAPGGYAYTATLAAAEGYALPDSITVTMGGSATSEFTYDPATGALTVNCVKGDLVITAEGVKQVSYLYLKPNSNWTQANARFAAYFFGNGEKWVDMADSDGDGIYEVELQEGYPNVIFCRMNPSATANNWNNKWNQTGDLTVPADGKNLFTVPDGSWDGATTAWSTHAPSTGGGEGGEGNDPAETVTVYFRNDWLWPEVYVHYWNGDNASQTTAWPGEKMTKVGTDSNCDVYSAEIPSWATKLIFNGLENNNPSNRQQTPDVTDFADGDAYYIHWDNGNKCSKFDYAPSTGGDEPTVTYIIAGTDLLCGTAWDVADTDNTMTLNVETGLYEKTYSSVAVGTHKFKVTDGTWNNSWGSGDDNDGNTVFTLSAISNVTITFNAETKAINVTSEATGEVAEPVTSVIIHFRNTGLWESVYYHAWIENGDSDAGLTTWPGTKLTENAAHSNWYTVELTGLNAANGIGILFDGGSDGPQTADIMITEDGEYWYDIIQGGLLTAAPDSWEDGSVKNVAYKVTLHFANLKGWGSVNLYTWTDGGETLTGAWPGSAAGLDSNGFYTMTTTYEAPEGQGLNFIFNGGAQTVDLKLPFTAFVKGDDGVYTAEKWVAPTTTDGEGKYYVDMVDAAGGIALPPVVSGTTVTFQYKGSTSDTVQLFGTMNNWGSPYTMSCNAYGVWSVTLENVPAGIHEYKFVVNGSWIADPLNSWTIGNDGNSAFLISDPNKDTNTIRINVHFNAPSAEWNVCAWGADGLEPQYDFENGIATITLDGRDAQYVCFKVRKSTPKNAWAEQSGEIRVDLSNIVSGTIDVYVGSDFSVSQQMNEDVVIVNKINSVELDYDNNTIIIQTSRPVGNVNTAFAIYQDGAAANMIRSISASGSTYTLQLNADLKLVTLHQYTIRFAEQEKYADHDYQIGINTVYASERFAAEYTYTGNDLGANWSEDQTVFRVWAPSAASVTLMLYRSGTADTDDLYFEAPMTQDVNGTWIAIVEGDLNGVYYTYYVNVGGESVEAVDPYARTTGVNGERGMVIDLDSTDPEGWENDTNPNPSTSYTDAVIYELHVRDFSIDISSGTKQLCGELGLKDYSGKFLAFTLEGTTVNGEGNYATGIDYLKSLGVTHVHLLPVYDYGSVDETKCDNFNWGYDPVNYNVPEGSYSIDPYHGEMRVSEFKQMVMALHEAGISVIMDVVYNHVYDAGKFCFNQIVPDYFSRFNADGSYSNGSGCGNDTASEREMVRKYIVESVNYWSDEYHIDGFRFDLVGLIDVTTINQIVDTVHEDRPDTIFYGEGWSMGTAVESGNDMATQGNSVLTPGFAYFSDTIRDLVSGAKEYGGTNVELGFVSGLTGKEEEVAKNFMAMPWWSNNPSQIIQYVSCHDNYTLADKLIIATGKSGVDADIIKMNNLAAAIYMTSQGIPFIHAGEEMLREKVEEEGGRCENSYNASDFVNSIKWSKLNDATYRANVEYYRGLIAFRKAHAALRMEKHEQVASNITYKWVTNEVVMFTINAAAAGDASDAIVVIFNANGSNKNVTLPEGSWAVCVNGEQTGTEVIDTVSGSVEVAGISAMVLVSAKEATVTLKNEGAQDITITGIVGTTLTAEAPEKEGYTFLGWFDANGAQMPALFPDANTTYTAKWEAKDITLTFNVMGNDVLTVTKKAGSAYEFEAAEPTMIGHNFVGWFDADGNEYVGIVPTVDTTYYAEWEPKDITITLMDGDTTLDTLTQKADTQFAIELVPTKEGYTFLGWFTEDGVEYDGWVPLVNTTYYACWEANDITLTFNVMGYDVLTVTKKAGSAYEFEAAEPTMIGHNFVGWFDANGNEYVGIVPTVDTTYYAEWEPKDITLTLMDGDTTLDTLTQKADTQFAIELVPTKEGYTFLGWFTEDGVEYDGWVPLVNTTYYACWEALSYDLTLNAGEGGEVEVSNDRPCYGETVTVTVTPAEGKLLHSIAATANGAALELTTNPDGTYSFIQPAGEVVITVVFRDLPEEPDDEPDDEPADDPVVIPQPEIDWEEWESLFQRIYELTGKAVDTAEQAYRILQILMRFAGTVLSEFAALLP